MLISFDGIKIGPLVVNAEIVGEFKKSCHKCVTFGYIWCGKTTNPFKPTRCANVMVNLPVHCRLELAYTDEDCRDPNKNPVVPGREEPNYEEGNTLDTKSEAGEKPCHGHVELLYYLQN